MRYATTTQIAQRFGVKPIIIQRRIRFLLLPEGLVWWQQYQLRQPWVCGITAAGASVADSQLSASEFKWSQFAHVLTTNDLYIWLEQQYPDATLQTDRELRAQEGAQLRKGPRRHVPDGLLTFPDGRRIAIEAELSEKGIDRIKAILLELARYDGSWYYCSTQGIANRIATLAAQRQSIQVHLLDGTPVEKPTVSTTPGDFWKKRGE